MQRTTSHMCITAPPSSDREKCKTLANSAQHTNELRVLITAWYVAYTGRTRNTVCKCHCPLVDARRIAFSICPNILWLFFWQRVISAQKPSALCRKRRHNDDTSLAPSQGLLRTSALYCVRLLTKKHACVCAFARAIFGNDDTSGDRMSFIIMNQRRGVGRWCVWVPTCAAKMTQQTRGDARDDIVLALAFWRAHRTRIWRVDQVFFVLVAHVRPMHVRQEMKSNRAARACPFLLAREQQNRVLAAIVCAEVHRTANAPCTQRDRAPRARYAKATCARTRRPLFARTNRINSSE